MSNLPKIYTQEDQTAKDVAAWKSGNEKDRLLIMLRAFASNQRNLPTTDDYVKVQQEATYDFRRNDYGEAQQYVDTLVHLVEFYKDLAETYLENLNDYGIVTDQYGYESSYPFVLREDGYEKIARVEVLDLEEHNRDDLWVDYVKPFLPLATETERAWISEKFAEQIEGESK